MSLTMAAPSVEHHYILDKYGHPVEIQSEVYTPLDSPQQLPQDRLLSDSQLGLFLHLFCPIEEHDIKRMITVIHTLRQSFRQQTKKLFAEIDEIKKRYCAIEQKNSELQQQLDELYETLRIEKRDNYDS